MVFVAGRLAVGLEAGEEGLGEGAASEALIKTPLLSN